MSHLPTAPRMRTVRRLAAPHQAIDAEPVPPDAAQLIAATRSAIHHILAGTDDRLLVVVGPCSIHDPAAARDFAARLAALRARLADDLEIVMRVYFEKPRSAVGWKGLIHDPDLDGSCRIEDGLRTARRLLRDINQAGLPAGCEFLDLLTPHYIADLVSWGAIGARTSESQPHRQMASGLPCPIGFKNGTSGALGIALDAMRAAAHPHHFMTLGGDGAPIVAATTGNADTHVILRGGLAPNYAAADVAAAVQASRAAGLPPRLMIDTSHANSGKRPENQPRVAAEVAAQVAAGTAALIGVMLEGNLVGGRQDFSHGAPLVYGQSITDGCMDWATTQDVLVDLAGAVRRRRQVGRRADTAISRPLARASAALTA